MLPLPLPETFEDLVAAWRSHGQSLGHSPRTIESRIYTVNKLARDGVDPLTATTAQISDWLASAGMKRSSIGTYRAQLRAWYAWLVLTDRRLDDPTAKLGQMRVDRGTPRPLSDASVVALLAACEDRRSWQTRAYVILACFAGLRVHEIAKIRGEDVSDTHVFVLGKGGKPGLVPLHPRVADLAARMPTSGHWFPSPMEGVEHVSRVSVGLAISRAMQRAKVAGTPHACRHYFATAVLRTSDILSTQSAMRHKSISTTSIYAQLPNDRVRDAVLRIDPEHSVA